MEDTSKYLIHAEFTADGVIERSDVVGAAFGQTEGLLGDDLDIPDLQSSSKLGRIDVSVEHTEGRSTGTITIASSMDRVETAVLAAALEAVERIGPCRASVRVTDIEDVRAAKRREVKERAKELLATAFDDGVLDSEEILDEVRESAKEADITEYEELPAGPHVASSDAVVVVEGRADVKRLLRYGVKNAIAVEGTNVPAAVADLTRERTTTVFLDGDRGGDLIRRELEQVGDIDYVARAPDGESVEDLPREQVDAALRNKTPYASADTPTAVTDGSTETVPAPAEPQTDAPAEPAVGDTDTEACTAGEEVEADEPAVSKDASATESGRSAEPASMADLAADVAGSGEAYFFDGERAELAAVAADDVFDALVDADPVPALVVLDGAVTQRVLDVAAQRGVGRIVGTERGEYVKQPAAVRVHTVSELE
ncbi:DNA primase DnaG [Salarchaeum sp. JOR-1]|uniref:DNA primase DnaG n=1 Tax=Salarchaeum sp. JOR-1 TaxID=2599399 RepID=UPI0011989293|nr:DNA primase DnaG [Salarchaeum sp. JOR-1]QDX40656.1 DNA primase [Salarchaeum sp. JOR-1]